MMFEIRDADGYTGVEAETLDGARLACTTIAREGYELPLEIVPEGERFPIEKLAAFDAAGRPVWQSSSLVRRYEGKAA